MELAKNRKAFYDYEILETFEGGLVLQGTEVKSLRNHGGNLAESYVRVIKNEAWLLGASIAPYRFGNIQNHHERRDRKVLLHKKEIQKLREASHQKGLTIVPLAFYLKQGRVKIKIAIGRGKKGQDKRHTIIERDRKREMDRAMKNR